MRGVTKSGFEWDVNAERLDDWEILEILSDMEDGKMLAAPKLLKKVLGDKSRDLLDHCRKDDGTVPTQAVLDEVFEIIGSLKEGKN